jgi:hypothetical protein
LIKVLLGTSLLPGRLRGGETERGIAGSRAKIIIYIVKDYNL